jgi:hypothetical protein
VRNIPTIRTFQRGYKGGEGGTDVAEGPDDGEIVWGWLDFGFDVLTEETSSFSDDIVIVVSWNGTFVRSSVVVVSVLIVGV